MATKIGLTAGFSLLVVAPGTAYLLGQLSKESPWSKAVSWFIGFAWKNPGVTSLTLLTAISLCSFLSWASLNFKKRQDLLSVCLSRGQKVPSGRALTVQNADLFDILPQQRQTNPKTKYLARKVRRFGSNQAAGEALQAIAETWQPTNKPARPIIILGQAGMGKTRLAFEAMQSLLEPETLIILPRVVKPPNDLEARLAYVQGRKVVLLLDDLNYYSKEGEPVRWVETVRTLASSLRVLATCTISTLSALRNETKPQLRDYFSAMEQLEILRITASDMEFLAVESKKTLSLAHAQAGNPGMFLFEWDSLREALSNMDIEVRELLKAIHAMFSAGSVVPLELLPLIAERLFGARPLYQSELKKWLALLKDLGFLRQIDPILPEESYLDALLVPAEAESHIFRIIDVLAEVSAADALFQIGIKSGLTGRPFEVVEHAYRCCATAGRTLGTSNGHILAALALMNYGNHLALADQDIEELESIFREAAMEGQKAGTGEGLVVAASSVFNLANALVAANRDIDDVRAAFFEAVELARKSDTPRGLVSAAGSLVNLGSAVSANTYWDRTEEISIFQEAAAYGRESGLPEGLVQVALAQFNLGNSLGQSGQDNEKTYRQAAATGRESDLPEGLMWGAQALVNVGLDLAASGRDSSLMVATLREAAALGHESGLLEGLFQAGKALSILGGPTASGLGPEELTATRREAAASIQKTVALAREDGSPASLVAAAELLTHLGGMVSDDAHWSRGEEKSIYREAARCGREAGVPEGLGHAALAQYNLGNSLERARQSTKEVEEAYREAIALGHQSGLPHGIVAISLALKKIAALDNYD